MQQQQTAAHEDYFHHHHRITSSWYYYYCIFKSFSLFNIILKRKFIYFISITSFIEQEYNFTCTVGQESLFYTSNRYKSNINNELKHFFILNSAADSKDISSEWGFFFLFSQFSLWENAIFHVTFAYILSFPDINIHSLYISFLFILSFSLLSFIRCLL